MLFIVKSEKDENQCQTLKKQTKLLKQVTSKVIFYTKPTLMVGVAG